MEYILALLIVPVLWIIASRLLLSHDISTKEMLIQFGITVVFVVAAYYISKANLTSDVEILNGQVTGKNYQHVSCSHSYSCHCYTYYTTDSKGRSTSHEHCDTCYEHAYDIDWNVLTNVGNLEIDRIDRQGVDTPPRWSNVYIGEPASTSKNYDNYIKGAKFSIFNYKDNQLDQKYAKMIPNYPSVYDYYRINRVVPVGILIPNMIALNQGLNNQLRILGPQKQANIVMVIVNTTDPAYRYALERAWIGGKKNDIIIVIGMTYYPQIAWVDVITLGKDAGNEMLQVQLRDQLLKLQSIEKADNVISIIGSTVASDFHRKRMKDYEYLKEEIQPSMTALIIISVLTLLCNIGLTIFFYKNREQFYE